MPFSVLSRTVLVSLGLLTALLIVGFISLLTGTSSTELREILFQGPASAEAQRTWTILSAYRLPRILLAALVGGGLATAGVVFQGALRNPLADPYIVGIAAGGALGAVLSIVFLGEGRLVGTSLAAFVGSLAAVGIVYSVAAA